MIKQLKIFKPNTSCHSAESVEVEIRCRLKIEVFNIIHKLKPQDIVFYVIV
jgi:hypothetical protein